MKSVLIILVILIFLSPIFLQAQTVRGKLVDENGNGLAEVNLHLYSEQTVYHTTSSEDGSFTFENITGVLDEKLPTGYSISNNYPNPFNPKTRIIISLPKESSVTTNVFNLLGESVIKEVEKYYAAGSSSIDLELNGLPNGLYFARISIDDKYTIVRKMMLVYGSQHLNTNDIGFSPLDQNYSNLKKTQETVFDSLVVESTIIGSKTFTILSNLVDGTIDFGNFAIERFCSGIPTVTYEGKDYNTIQIGHQCWLKENLDVGTMIGDDNQIDNGTIEKYCFDNVETNCDNGGGLYQWHEAMQYATTEGTQGICPSGWHIPTYSELYMLANYANGESTKLVDKSQTVLDIASTNETGFSALYTGYRYSEPGFNGLLSDAKVLSSTEMSSDLVYTLYMFWHLSDIRLTYSPKLGGSSVRCLKDVELNGGPKIAEISFPGNGKTNISIQPTLEWEVTDNDSDEVTFDLYFGSNSTLDLVSSSQTELEFQTDLLEPYTTYYWKIVTKDGINNEIEGAMWSFTTSNGLPCLDVQYIDYENKRYNTVQIDNQCWLKENLDVGNMIVSYDSIDVQTNNDTIEKYCYNNNEAYCNYYGGLYQWDEAMQYVSTEGTQGICPSGWHIPTQTEWETFNFYVNNEAAKILDINQTTSGYTATNETGFSAMFGGLRGFGGFYFLGSRMYLRSSTENTSSNAFYLKLTNYNSNFNLSSTGKDDGYSVRCLKD